MGKISSEILNIYCTMDEQENGDCTILGTVKWNGREPKGYDIRKYKKEENAVYKGITISYEALDKLILTAIEQGLVDVNKVKQKISEFDSKIFSVSDFEKMFDKLITEQEFEFKRDKHGLLRDENGKIVILGRTKRYNNK